MGQNFAPSQSMLQRLQGTPAPMQGAQMMPAGGGINSNNMGGGGMNPLIKSILAMRQQQQGGGMQQQPQINPRTMMPGDWQGPQQNPPSQFRQVLQQMGNNAQNMQSGNYGPSYLNSPMSQQQPYRNISGM